jgi:hypothetical protein
MLTIITTSTIINIIKYNKVIAILLKFRTLRRHRGRNSNLRRRTIFQRFRKAYRPSGPAQPQICFQMIYPYPTDN